MTTDIRRELRKSVVELLQSDLDGKAENFKDVWELCDGPEDFATVDDELRQLIKTIKGIR